MACSRANFLLVVERRASLSPTFRVNPVCRRCWHNSAILLFCEALSLLFEGPGFIWWECAAMSCHTSCGSAEFERCLKQTLHFWKHIADCLSVCSQWLIQLAFVWGRVHVEMLENSWNQTMGNIWCTCSLCFSLLQMLWRKTCDRDAVKWGEGLEETEGCAERRGLELRQCVGHRSYEI